jgi:hypothetical protein
VEIEKFPSTPPPIFEAIPPYSKFTHIFVSVSLYSKPRGMLDLQLCEMFTKKYVGFLLGIRKGRGEEQEQEQV